MCVLLERMLSMLNRRHFVTFVAVLTLFASLPSAQAASNGTSARSFIEALAGDAVQSLTVEGVERTERIVRFRALLKENFDVALIGRWVLGRHWRKATDAERAEYMGLFEDLIVVTYVDRFDQYAGEKLNVVKAIEEKDKDAVVTSEIVRPTGGDTVKVDWRVRLEGDTYHVIDVMVEGVSMSQTQRSEFASVIRSKGGAVAGLIEVLRDKVKALN